MIDLAEVLSWAGGPSTTALRLRLQMLPPPLTAPPRNGLAVDPTRLPLVAAKFLSVVAALVVVSAMSRGRSLAVKTRGMQVTASASSMVEGQEQANTWLSGKKEQESEQLRTRQESNTRSVYQWGQ